MKPDDVMMALECCSVYADCDGCPHFDGVPENDCRYKAMANALSLIREKDAEIERLKLDLESWRQYANRYFSRSISAELEIDKYRELLKSIRESISKHSSEIKELGESIDGISNR